MSAIRLGRQVQMGRQLQFRRMGIGWGCMGVVFFHSRWGWFYWEYFWISGIIGHAVCEHWDAGVCKVLYRGSSHSPSWMVTQELIPSINRELWILSSADKVMSSSLIHIFFSHFRVGSKPDWGDTLQRVALASLDAARQSLIFWHACHSGQAYFEGNTIASISAGCITANGRQTNDSGICEFYLTLLSWVSYPSPLDILNSNNLIVGPNAASNTNGKVFLGRPWGSE